MERSIPYPHTHESEIRPRERIINPEVDIHLNSQFTRTYPFTHYESQFGNLYTISNNAQSDITCTSDHASLQNLTATNKSVQKHPVLWTSVWLQRSTLLGFSGLFTSLWIAVALLWYYNIKTNGFPLTVSSNPYTWTYGPTVVLTIVVGLWRQVDYHCKLVQPWKAMQSHYVSPLQIISLWRAFKNRHWAVVLTVIGFTLLKAVIVSSTSFLVTKPTSLLGRFPIIINSKFDGSDFLFSLEGNYDPGDWNIPSTPVYTLLGILNGQYQSPPQILNDSVIQTFDPRNVEINTTTITGLVEILSPECYYDSDQTCSIEGPCQIFQMLQVNCSEENIALNYSFANYNPPVIDNGNVYDLRLALVVANLSAGYKGPALTEDEYKSIRPTAAICKIDYDIQRVNLTKGLRDNDFSFPEIQSPVKSTHLHNLSGIINNKIGYGTHDYEDSIFGLITLALPETMKSSFIRVFIPDNLPSEGQGVYSEDRLHVQALSALLMIIAMFFIAPRHATPQDPALLASHGIVLARRGSPVSDLERKTRGIKFQTTLTNDGNSTSPGTELPNSQRQYPVKRRLWKPLFARYPIIVLTFTLPILSIIGLEILYQLSQKNHGLNDSENTPSYYVRYLSSVAALIIATLFNSLDFTLSSHAHFHALRSGTASGSNAIMTNLIQMMPPEAWYRALRNRYFGAISSITAAILGSLLTVVVSGLWGVDLDVVVSTAVSATIGTEWDLSWKNSSLEDGGAADRQKEVLTNSSSSPDGIWDNLIFPEIINFDLQKSEFFNSTFITSSHEALSSVYINMEVPALRPQLRCEPVTKVTVTEENTYGTWTDALYPLPKHCHGRPGKNMRYGQIRCNSGEREGSWFSCFVDLHMHPWNATWNSSIPNYEDSGEHPALNQPDNPNGCPSIGVMFGYRSRVNGTSPTANITSLFCYQEIEEIQTTISFLYEDLEDGLPFKPGEKNIRFAPFVNESTAIKLTNGTSGFESFHFRVESHLRSQIWDWPGMVKGKHYDDPIFETILHGPDSIPQEDLIGPQNRQRLQDAVNRQYQKYMVQVINSPIFRKPLNSSLFSSSPLSNPERLASTISTKVLRLKVNFVLKLVLQILLAIMTVLGGIGFSLMRVRGMLPRDPYSIASSKALFAGSEFSARARRTPGAEWMDAGELKALLGEQGFSLGWWEVREREIDDADVDADTDRTERFGVDFGSAVYRRFVRG
ncbi:hypothetical protein HD806DRAFT_520891 [Xylariaceae sp. AK1471]|nr:hypothetical protein HD806DRAFT_520891 [Xylariaceae sp. AK1471]